MSTIKNVDDCYQFYKKVKKDSYWGRLGKTFSTDNHRYFYDTGTGKIARLKENVFLVLECLLENEDFEALNYLQISESEIFEAFNEIQEAIENQHILSAMPIKNFGGMAVEDLETILDNEVQHIILETTQKCNLRCKYCIYHPDHPSFREFGHRDMDIDTAKKAVDLLLRHSSDQEKVYVGFYGGEPLMNYKLVQETVAYAKEKLKHKELIFSMTTNVTLITPEIADFLAVNNFYLTLSVDGPKEIHDENRLYATGKPTFDDVERGIKYLLHAYEQHDMHQQLLFNIVVTGPDYSEKYAKIEDFIKNTEWLPDDVSVITNTVDIGPVEHEPIRGNSEEERKFLYGYNEPVNDWVLEKKKIDSQIETFADGTIEKGLLQIHKRLLLKEPVDKYGLQGCCVPGYRRAYVSVNGELYACEKVGNVPSLGNVSDGFDKSKIRKYYVDDYTREVREHCKDCWAINICGLCYVNCYDENGIHYSYRHTRCPQERLSLENSLIMYHQILENDPEKIAALSDVEIS